MNPEIERILELEEQARQATVCKDIKKDVSDTEMATYYSNLTNTVRKIYEGRNNNGGRRKMNLPDPINKNPQKRPRFMKPELDE